MKKEDLDFLNGKCTKKFETVKLSVDYKSFTDKKDVENAIRNFNPVDGWISFQSAHAIRIKDSSFDINEYILAGEFVNSQTQSLSIRFTGDDWILVTTWENDEGEELIKSSSKQLSKLEVKEENIFLNYNIYYKNDDELGCRPYVSAFAGFSEGK